MRRVILLAFVCYFFNLPFLSAQLAAGEKEHFTHADTLRGAITPERAWWNVLYYDIHVTPNYEKKFITGVNNIRFEALKTGEKLQLDLQIPMNILSITWNNKPLTFKREGNAFHVSFPREIKKGSIETLSVRYEGNPRVAIRPPLGRWLDLDKRSRGAPMDERGLPGIGRQCLVPL